MRTRRLWIVALVALLAALVGRAILEGRAAVRRADEAEARGDVEGTIAWSMRAAKWYVPGATHPRIGYDKLREVARKAEAAGDLDTALIAWQAIRAAGRATRGPWVPWESRAREADAQIAILLTAKGTPGIDRDKPRERVIQEHRALLARDDGPRPAAVAAFYVGLAIAALGSFRLLAAVDALLARDLVSGSPLRGMDREPERRRAWAALGVAVVGFAVFVIALSRA
ncbi:MAG: hypothetical protein HYV09_30375 [Deltaproteobacteria bacterium]|nr:hypothetical protein [Deltaproteobacteria bacterium]